MKLSTTTPFQIGITKSFTEAVKTAQKAIDHLKPDVKTFYIMSDGKYAYFVGYSDDIRVMLNIHVTSIKGSGLVQVNPKLMVDILKKRVESTITYKDGRLNLKSGKFQGQLPTEEISDYAVSTVREIFNERQGNTITLSETITESIKLGIKLIRIKNLYVDEPINCYVTYRGGQLMMGGNDDFHLALYRHKLKTSDKEFQTVFPIGLFDIISSVFGDESVDLVFGPGDILIKSSQGRLVIPPVQADEGGFDVIPNFLLDLPDPSLEFEFQKDFIDALSSIAPFNHRDDPLDFTVTSKSVNVSIDSQTGKARDQLPVRSIRGNTELVFALNPRIMTDLFDTVTKHMKYPTTYKQQILFTLGYVKGKAVRVDYAVDHDIKARITLVGVLA